METQQAGTSGTLAERNKTHIREGIEKVWNKTNWGPAPETYADDIVVHAPTEPDGYHGRDDFKRLWTTLHEAYPDFHMTIEDIFAEENRVAARFTIRGTNTGPYMGMSPTGKSMAVEEFAIFHFNDDGKIREIWFGLNEMDVGRQLGVIPDGPPPKALIALMRFTQRVGKLFGGK